MFSDPVFLISSFLVPQISSFILFLGFPYPMLGYSFLVSRILSPWYSFMVPPHPTRVSAPPIMSSMIYFSLFLQTFFDDLFLCSSNSVFYNLFLGSSNSVFYDIFLSSSNPVYYDPFPGSSNPMRSCLLVPPIVSSIISFSWFLQYCLLLYISWFLQFSLL